jgi:hypothetical protein
LGTKGRLYKDTHQLGYNTRDNPQDVPFESGRMLVNVFPGDPSCFPRDGIPAWNSVALSAAPSHAFPWADRTEPKVLLHIGQDLAWKKAGSGAATVFAAAVVPVGAKLSFFRIKDLGFINIDLTGASHRAWIVSWTGSTFALRNANITRPTFVLGSSLQAGGAVPYRSWRGYSFTLVNRTDPASVDGGGAPKLCRLQDGNFHPGLLESVDDLDNRLVVEQTDASGAKAIRVTCNRNGNVIDTQVTHLRIHVTEDAEDQVEAEGFERRWLADVPIIGTNAYSEPWTYDDTTTAAQLAGDLDILKTIGYDPLPPGLFLYFHQGLLWAGGIGTGEEIGRVYYSQVPLDVEFPQKWWSMFRLGEYFKDIAYEDGEAAVGLGVAHGDLILFGPRTHWYLRDGDPNFEPKLIATKGTAFPNSITQVNQDLFVLFNDGPGVVTVRQVDTLQAHTAGEVWPKISDNSRGYFFTLTDKTAVRGFFFRENWWLTDGVKLIGHYMPSKGTAQGPWSVEPGDPAIGFHLPIVLDPEELCVLVSKTLAAPKLWSFLSPGVSLDNGAEYWLKGSSKAYYVDKRNRDKSGELFTIKVFTHYEDSATMYITVRCDFFRFVLELGYNEYGTDNQLVSPDAGVSFRNIVEQPFPEGMVFQFVEVEWRKLHRTPYGFTHKGWALEYLPVDGHPSEFVSKSSGDGLVLPFPDAILYLKFDDDSMQAEDFSIFGRDHNYGAGSGGSRAFNGSLAPGGGQALVGGPGSGYVDPDWTGTDYIGTSAGLNGASLTYEYVVLFPALASEQIIHEGGNGSVFWRLAVKADGSLEYQLKTSILAYRFNSPAGSVAAAAWYTIQFVLSNQGLNGQFYAGPRTGESSELLTTRSALP